jgi:hypothetical protein
MKLASLSGARAAYYDRNASSVNQNYYAVAAAHASTTRFTYTVASGKKLLIESQAVRIHRQTAATTAGRYYTELLVSDGTTDVLGCSVHQTDNTTSVQYLLIGAQQVTLYAGETIRCNTYDISTGGTVEYFSSFKGTLYSA